MCVYLNNSSYISVLFASSTSGTIGRMRKTHAKNGVIDEDQSWYYSDSSSYTYNGETVYYRTASLNFEGCTILYPTVSSTLPTSGLLAWTMVYGNIVTNGEMSVPVQWMRSDGALLEDSFTVTVNEDEYADEAEDESSGWFDMGSGFSGSGGGSF